MRITGSQVGPVTPAQLSQIKKTAPTSAADTTRPADEVQFSSDVEAIEAARKAIAAAPDVRQDKVEALRQQIAAGTYQISSEKIADKMLAEARLFQINRK